ncbi:SGNH/GDSL hydrolase family protein [Pseudarthrobacter siccitolerans]|nr:SGNH/GDSL hydrolase family protein [Pseudarthrobacter siccitolerans]
MAEKGSPSGVASLDVNAKILPSQLPDSAATSATQIATAISTSDLISPRVVSRALGRLHAGLAARLSTPARLVFTGSSTTQGQGATTAEARYADIMLRRIQAQFPATAGVEVNMIMSNSANFGALSATGGVHGYNAGEGGKISSTYLTDTEVDSINAIAPLAVFHMVGSNDFAGNQPIPTYKANVLERVNRLKANATAPLVQILLQPFERFDAAVLDGTEHAWAEYGQALNEIAHADPDNVAYLDVSAPFYAAGVPGADPLNLIGPDGLHQTDAGHYLMAMLILRGLGLNTATTPIAPAPAPPSGGLQLVLDYFNRADTTPPGTSLTGQEWSVASGAWAIESGRLRATSGGTVVIDSGFSDFDVTTVVALQSDGLSFGLFGRAVADTSRVGAFFDLPNGKIAIWCKYGATNAQRAVEINTALFKSGANIVRVRGIGSTITAYVNGTKAIEHKLDATDTAGVSNILGNTFVGIRSAVSTIHTWDNFAANIP